MSQKNIDSISIEAEQFEQFEREMSEWFEGALSSLKLNDGVTYVPRKEPVVWPVLPLAPT